MTEHAVASGCVVLVTGGAGFIGSHTVDRLLQSDCRVAVLDDFSTGRRENLSTWDGDDRLLVIEADVAGKLGGALAPVIERWGRIDRCIHLAAQTSVVKSVEEPVLDAITNYLGTVQVLDYLRDKGVAKVVFASSAAIYGDVAGFPVKEEFPCVPLSPYGVNKLSSEHFLRYQSAICGIPTSVLRFFNVYGPRQDPSSPYSGVISIFVDRAAAGRDLVVFGDGEQTRDFVYVSDVVDAVVGACLRDDGDGTPINIGTGREVTINRIAQLIVDRVGGQSKVVHGPPRDGEITRSVAAVERARDLLGFAARVELADGLAETVDSLR